MGDNYFFAYGSLMSHKSLKKTIQNKRYKQAIIKNCKRIFNIKERRFDVLNLLKSRNSMVNGVLFKLNKSELKKIKKRESGYNLEQTWAYDFKTRKKLCTCFLVIDYHVCIDQSKNKPSKDYFILCREAAYHISKKFGKMWDDTTYTSDGKSISEWIKLHKEYDTLVVRSSL